MQAGQNALEGVCFNCRKIKLSVVFAGQDVGVKQVSENIWLVSFVDYDLGYVDDKTCRLEPLGNRFGPKVVTDLSGTWRSELARSC